MTHLRDDRKVFEATAERYRVYRIQEREEFKRDMLEIVLMVAAAIILACLLYVILLPSAEWCHANYPVENVPECLFRENLLFGRFIH